MQLLGIDLRQISVGQQHVWILPSSSLFASSRMANLHYSLRGRFRFVCGVILSQRRESAGADTRCGETRDRGAGGSVE